MTVGRRNWWTLLRSWGLPDAENDLPGGVQHNSLTACSGLQHDGQQAGAVEAIPCSFSLPPCGGIVPTVEQHAVHGGQFHSIQNCVAFAVQASTVTE